MEYFSDNIRIYPISNETNFISKIKKSTFQLATITDITINQSINGIQESNEYRIPWLQKYLILKDNLNSKAQVIGLNNYNEDYATLHIQAKQQINSQVKYFSANITSLDSIVEIAKDGIKQQIGQIDTVSEYNFCTLINWQIKLYFKPSKDVLGISFLEPLLHITNLETKQELKQLKIHKIPNISIQDGFDLTGKLRSKHSKF